MASSLRQIVEEESFDKSKTDLAIIDERLDDALLGVTFVLSHSPTSGKRTDSPDVWAITTYPLLGLPPLIVYYGFDDKKVRLLVVEKADWPNGSQEE